MPSGPLTRLRAPHFGGQARELGRDMKALAEQIVDLDSVEIYGRVVGVRGLMVEVAGPIHAMSVGSRLSIETGTGPAIPCEVVGFSGGHALAMPFAALDGVRRGCRAVVAIAAGTVRPSERWLGRVINAIGEPIDGENFPINWDDGPGGENMGWCLWTEEEIRRDADLLEVTDGSK